MPLAPEDLQLIQSMMQNQNPMRPGRGSFTRRPQDPRLGGSVMDPMNEMGYDELGERVAGLDAGDVLGKQMIRTLTGLTPGREGNYSVRMPTQSVMDPLNRASPSAIGEKMLDSGLGELGLGAMSTISGAPRAAAEILGRFKTTTPGRIVKQTKADGGYSVQPATGEVPTEGLFVGKYANTDPRNTIGPAINQKMVKKHAAKNAKAFEDSENFFGTWLDSADGHKAYLDVSRKFPPAEIRAATKFGERTAQKSGFNKSTMEEFPIGNAPQWLRSPEFQKRLDEMRAVGKKHMGGKEWWDLHGGPIEETYAQGNADLLRQIAGYIASTSPKNNPETNLRLASEYIRRAIKGEPIVQKDFRIPETAVGFTPGKQLGMEGSRVNNLERSSRGDIDALRLDKVNDMGHALLGDKVGVYDRRFSKLGDNPSKGVFMETKPDTLAGAMDGTPELYAHMENAVRDGAKRSGESLEIYSSEVWEGIGETIKNTGELYGVKHGAHHIPESSQGFNVLFPKLVASKAKHLGITVPEMLKRLKSGDAELLTLLLATPIGAALYQQAQQEKRFD